MKLSIVIPVYNIEAYIATCIESVYTQGLDENDFELIIVNDGTKDNSLRIAEEYQLKHRNMVIHTQPNAGLAAARNKGLSLAKGTYIYFLDGDDYLISNGLSQVLSLMEEKHLDVFGFGTSITTSTDDITNASPTIEIKDKDVIDGYTFIAAHSYRNEAWWYMIRRAYVLDLGITFPVGQQFEDSIFTHRLLLNASRVVFTPVALHRYVQRANSIRHNREPEFYRNVIKDLNIIILDYTTLLAEIEQANIDPILKKRCIHRVKCRQQSFVFFMIARFLKSNLKFSYLKEILYKLKKTNAYPLREFIGEEYNGWKYKAMVTLFNSRLGLPLSFLVLRLKQKVMH